MSIYIYHHLGLGDHIICNAIVRNYAKNNDLIYLFVKPCNFDSVSFMYRDLNNIKFLIGDDNFAEKYIKDNNITNLLKVGFEKLQIKRNIFDESFYEIANIPFEKRWTDFYLPRDTEKELEVFNGFGVKENEYAFIQIDSKRSISIDMSKIKSGLEIVTSENNIKFFDMCYLIENAAEVHSTESAFRPLIEHLNMKTEQLFLHKSSRSSVQLSPTIRKKWFIV